MSRIQQIDRPDDENLEIAEWHKDLLDERERSAASGNAHSIDWEEARKQIKEAIE